LSASPARSSPAVAGDAGVGITALAWLDPTLFSLVLIGAWEIVRAIAGGTIAVTTRTDHSLV
jgi:hypothetical protein